MAMAVGLMPAFAQQEIPDSLRSQQITTAAQGEILMDTIPTTDGFYQANNLEDAVPFAYPEVNMKNIRFYKRVWRDIDLKDEKMHFWRRQEFIDGDYYEIDRNR